MCNICYEKTVEIFNSCPLCREIIDNNKNVPKFNNFYSDNNPPEFLQHNEEDDFCIDEYIHNLEEEAVSTLITITDDNDDDDEKDDYNLNDLNNFFDDYSDLDEYLDKEENSYSDSEFTPLIQTNLRSLEDITLEYLSKKYKTDQCWGF